METSRFIDHFSEIWNNSSDRLPAFTNTYSDAEKREREALFSTYTDRFRELRKEGNAGSIDTEKFFRGLRSVMKQIYDYTDESLELITNRAMIDASRDFYREARAFDSSLSREEIYQAMRNAWIMNGLQLLLGLPVRLTPSILAYSLLYPYSDNLLDGRAVPVTEKVVFSRRFESCLRGKGKMGNNPREQAIEALVEMICQEYPRDRFLEVHQSLLAIHRAQTHSLRLCGCGNPPSTGEILRIGFDKGGSSVLADGYLVAGHLSPEISRFFYGYGIWLQLSDDIQDLEEDLADGTLTLFSAPENRTSLPELTNRTFHFGRAVMEDIKCCKDGVSKEFGKVILKSIELMLLQAAGLSSRFFPPDYRHRLEEFSPLGFDYLLEARKKGNPSRMKLITSLIDEVV
ncbi:MAG TPA: class 1 isoprenoid biosynthesis enzyme [Prolixibacteraceae bacterium]|nr:class 1 isoprenoid biosynthesis enzyme [Prolixibacteraceae bacterium]